jgi:hypothetical protein
MNHKFNKIRQILVAFVLLAAVTGISSCEKNSFILPVVDPGTTWHFQADIQPIFNANCTSCHGGAKAPDLRDGKSYLSLTNGAFVNTPGETSKLYTKLTGSHLSRASDTERSKILGWINQGALNN